MLTRAFELNDKHCYLNYALVDIFCRRHCLFHAHYIIEKLEKMNCEILTQKAWLKYYLITGNKIEIMDAIDNSYNKNSQDEEYISLIMDGALNFNIPHFTYLVAISPYANSIFDGLGKRGKSITKNHMNKVLIEVIGKYLHELENS